jgi:Tfp pilus assembly protein PilF
MGAEMRLATLAGQRPPPLPSLPAYEHYLRGRVHCRRWTTEEFRKGVAELEAGIALAPAYAPAYATLAACYGSAAMFGHQPPAELRLVRRAAVAKALELAPNSGESHRVAAGAAFREDWDWSRAEVAFRQAISLEPNNAPARQGYAWYLAAMGRFAEAREQVDEARRIDPVSVPHLLASGTVALFSGAFDQAAEECRKAVGLDPGNSVSRAYLGWALVLKGHHKQALEELETANRLSAGDPFTASMLAYGYGRAGRVAAARQVLDDLGALARQRYVSAFYAALVHTALEEPDAALSRLEKAFEERNAWLVWLKVDQRLDPLRARPRFQALLGRMQFPGSTDPPRHSIRAEHE